MSFKVIIAGSRSFRDYKLLREKCDILLSQKEANGIMIISGHAKGADQLGERYAAERGFRCDVMPAKWDKYGKSAGYKRNVSMAEEADALIAFWDGKSRGTEHMIRIAKDRGLQVRVIRF